MRWAKSIEVEWDESPTEHVYAELTIDGQLVGLWVHLDDGQDAHELNINAETTLAEKAVTIAQALIAETVVPFDMGYEEDLAYDSWKDAA